MNLARASSLIAAGTLVSRMTGLVRTIVLVAAISSVGASADAFYVANQLPNTVLTLISTGLLTGVIVPRVVAVSAQADGGRIFLPKLITAGAAILLLTTAVAIAIAPALVAVMASGYDGATRELTIAFAYWCLPQIFFYGMFALIGESLNARRMFTPYAWAPVVNNIVSIAGFGLFIVLFGFHRTEVGWWTPSSIALVGGTATLGIVAQTVVLAVAWRRSGIPLRPDFRWRGVGFGSMGSLATWTFGMVVVTLLAGLVQVNVMSAASGENASVAVWGNAWLIYMVPYSLIVLSIGTPYFTRIAEHAAAGRGEDVRADISAAIRILGLFVVISAGALIAAAAPASRIFTSSAGDALLAAPVLIAFLVGLVPMAVLFIIQRTFYAYGDTRTPFFFTLAQGALVVVLTLVAVTVPKEFLTATVASVQTLCGILELLLATWLLRRKIGPLGIRKAVSSLALFIGAAIPAALAGWGIYLWSGAEQGWMLDNLLLGAAGTALICSVAGAIYLGILAALRTPELTSAITLVRARFGRR
ncbi:murein biosynthesis integral membrane protein MurJ [Microbacterium sp. RURRCA19A]|uniref:murein biosynthesis integral membrane protein MurJ n=1 Tax=Microbacterium sp. RURRCA19A TaxID=1907391 RepID=UPI00095437B5|nr:lipid II flippase MurJ [Microbacterium sp. RURRCA19A]SIR55434.1 putative peptidoglycan lipid II flippase [Microbacterium sp. RURRCA19A]